MNMLKIVEEIMAQYTPVFNFTPLEWSEIFVATYSGQEDLNWEDKIQWTRSHTLKELEQMEQMTDPAYFDAVRGLRQIVTEGVTDYIGRLDAAGMGATSLGVASNDPRTMELGNLIMDPTASNRVHMYPIIYKHFHRYLGSNLYQDIPDESMNKSVIKIREPNNPMGYKALKEACYTAMYDSISTPYKLFGNNIDSFNQALYANLKGPMLLRDRIASTTDIEKDFYELLAPDGMTVHKSLYKTIEKRIESPLTRLINNKTGSLTLKMEVVGLPDYDKSRPAIYAQSIDAFIMRMFHVIMGRYGASTQGTHDEYGCTLDSMNMIPFVIAAIMAALSFYYKHNRNLSFADGNLIKIPRVSEKDYTPLIMCNKFFVTP